MGNFTGTTSAQLEPNLPMSVAEKKSRSGSLFCAFLCFFDKKLCKGLQDKKKVLPYSCSESRRIIIKIKKWIVTIQLGKTTSLELFI